MKVTRICAATQFKITVAKAKDLELDDGDGKFPWYVVCEEHNTAFRTNTHAKAQKNAVWPEWCAECCPVLEKTKKRRNTLNLTYDQKKTLRHLKKRPSKAEDLVPIGLHYDAFRLAKLGLIEADPKTHLLLLSEEGKKYVT